MEDSKEFKENKAKYEKYDIYKKELDKLEEQIWSCNYLLRYKSYY